MCVPCRRGLTAKLFGSRCASSRRLQTARDVPFNVQWIGRRDFVYPLGNWLGWGTGWPLGLAGIAGIGLVLWHASHHHNEQALTLPFGLIVAALWTLFIFLFYGAQFSKFTRYLLPRNALSLFVRSMAAVRNESDVRLAAQGISAVYRSSFSIHRYRPAHSALGRRRHFDLHARTHARRGSQWIRANVPRGTTVAIETAWDDALPLGGAAGLQVLDLKLYDRDDAAKRAHLLDTLDRAQWIFVSSQRAWASIPRWPRRWPSQPNIIARSSMAVWVSRRRKGGHRIRKFSVCNFPMTNLKRRYRFTIIRVSCCFAKRRSGRASAPPQF